MLSEKNDQLAAKAERPRKALQAGAVRQSGRQNPHPGSAHMRQLARGYSEEALGKLVQLMRGVVKVGRKSIPVPIHTQGWAAAEIINRGWGRAPQGLEVTGANGGPIEFEERTAREYVLGRIAGIRERLLAEGLVIDAEPVEAADSERPN
jgi:hypothetical protein